MIATKNEAQPDYVLDASHRCDRCGAQALVLVMLNSINKDLLFCGHHWGDNRKALETKDITVVDESARLNI
jgi:hypothetical protein